MFSLGFLTNALSVIASTNVCGEVKGALCEQVLPSQFPNEGLAPPNFPLRADIQPSKPINNGVFTEAQKSNMSCKPTSCLDRNDSNFYQKALSLDILNCSQRLSDQIAFKFPNSYDCSIPPLGAKEAEICSQQYANFNKNPEKYVDNCESTIDSKNYQTDQACFERSLPPVVIEPRTITVTKSQNPIIKTAPPLIYKVPSVITRYLDPITITKSLPPKTIIQPPIIKTIIQKSILPASTVLVDKILPPIVQTVMVQPHPITRVNPSTSFGEFKNVSPTLSNKNAYSYVNPYSNNGYNGQEHMHNKLNYGFDHTNYQDYAKFNNNMHPYISREPHAAYNTNNQQPNIAYSPSVSNNGNFLPGNINYYNKFEPQNQNLSETSYFNTPGLQDSTINYEYGKNIAFKDPGSKFMSDCLDNSLQVSLDTNSICDISNNPGFKNIKNVLSNLKSSINSEKSKFPCNEFNVQDTSCVNNNINDSSIYSECDTSQDSNSNMNFYNYKKTNYVNNLTSSGNEQPKVVFLSDLINNNQ